MVLVLNPAAEVEVVHAPEGLDHWTVHRPSAQDVFLRLKVQILNVEGSV